MRTARAGAPGSRRGRREPSGRRPAPLTYDVRDVFIMLDLVTWFAYVLDMPATQPVRTFVAIDPVTALRPVQRQLVWLGGAGQDFVGGETERIQRHKTIGKRGDARGGLLLQHGQNAQRGERAKREE